jgi:hypothetical protein
MDPRNGGGAVPVTGILSPKFDGVIIRRRKQNIVAIAPLPMTGSESYGFDVPFMSIQDG